MSFRTPIGWYGGWMAALTALYYATPGWHVVVWGVIGTSSGAAIAVGTWRNRPRRISPWCFLAMSIVVFVTGNTVNNLPRSVTEQHDWLPELAGALYLALFPLLIVAVVKLTRAGAGNRDPASLMDSLALACGVGLLLWIFLVAPNLRDPNLTLLDSITAILFPLGDLALLAAVTRLMIAVRRSPAVLLLIFGTAGLFVSDVLYGLAQIDGQWQRGTFVDLGWIAFYGLWGAAALHPSMVELTKPRILQQPSASLRRLLLPGLSCLIGPSVLLVEAASGSVRDGMAIAVTSTITLGLSLPRVAGLMITHRQGLDRERGLRSAAGALVSATDAAEVEAVVLRTVAQLMPRRTHHRTFFAIRDLWATGRPVGGEGAHLLARLDETDPVAVTQLRYTRALPPEIATQIQEFETTLVCPLALDGLPTHAPNVGVLLVAAAEMTLISVQGVVDVLASQAALALDHIRLTADNKRRASDEYFRTLVQNAADVILIIEDAGTIRYASPSAAAVFGADDPTGAALPDLVHASYQYALAGVLDRARAGGPEPEVPTVLQLADGSTHIELACRDLRTAPTVHGLVVTLRDVTTRIAMQAELHQRAYYDTLTGLANRTAFVDRLTAAASDAGRSGATVGAILIDLDDFKAVNDRLGHGTGDALLVEASRRLKVLLLPYIQPLSADGGDQTVVAARLGSDEFAVLVDHAKGQADVDEVAQRIVEAFAQPFLLPDVADAIASTASVGVATTVTDETAQDLLRHADLALYAAKDDGKARWVRYDRERHMKMLDRMELRADLHQAVADPDLADSQFTLHYQPIVDLVTGETVGFEGLLRWQHPTRGLVPPLAFIDLAEESTAVISRLGAWVLRTGIAAAAHWYHHAPAGGRSPYVSVNVSPAQFRTPGFADLVRAELAAAKLPPDRLLLEITESLVLDKDDDAWADLRGLQSLGVRVAIDDFGTGYSSLSYLPHAEVDLLKLDRSFISTITTSPSQLAVVDAAIRLAEKLGMKVVAEGIETTADRDALRRLGCHLGQGYLYARPMSLEDADRWLAGAARAA